MTASWPGDPRPFAALSLAHLYPNHVHIGDALLLDPSRPRQNPPHVDQTHESLRLFPSLLDRLAAAASQRGAEMLTLTAANRPLRDTFERYGFCLADTIGARWIESAGLQNSFPMARRL